MANKIVVSVQRFNTIYGGGNPTLVFLQNRQGFTRTPDFQSAVIPGCYYHFEFWYKGEDTYACIHTTHDPASNINLINLIQARFGHIEGILSNALGRQITIVPLQGWSGGGAPNETHTLNIKCSNTNPNYNADLMYQLFQYTLAYPI